MTPKQRGKHAVIYDRTSVRDVDSMAEHLERCRAYCTANDLEVVAEETDPGISGFHDRVRPGWVRVKQMVEDGEVDVVVFFALSRIERSIVRTFQFVRLCEDHGVTFVSVTEEINSGGRWGKIVLAVLSAAAEIEALNKQDRALVGRETNVKGGYWSGGLTGFGFRAVPDGKKKRLVVEEKEAALIRDAATRVLNGKGSPTGIAREWNDAGYKTVGAKSKGGRPWSKGHVVATLTAERNVPLILTETVHRALVRLFDGRRTGRAPDRYLLTGILRCGRCGAGMTGRGGKYICAATGPMHLSASKIDVDQTVMAQAAERPEPEEIPVPDDPTAELVQRKEDVLARMRDLGRQLQLPPAVLEGRAEALQAELDAVERDITDATPEEPPGYFGGLLKDAENVDLHLWLMGLIKDAVLAPASPGANRFDPSRVTVQWR